MTVEESVKGGSSTSSPEFVGSELRVVRTVLGPVTLEVEFELATISEIVEFSL